MYDVGVTLECVADWWREVIGEIHITYMATHHPTPQHSNANWGQYCLAMTGGDFRTLGFTTGGGGLPEFAKCQNPATKPFLALVAHFWNGGTLTAQEILGRRNAAIAELVARTVDGKNTFLQTLNCVYARTVYPLVSCRIFSILVASLYTSHNFLDFDCNFSRLRH